MPHPKWWRRRPLARSAACAYAKLVLDDGATYYWRLNETDGVVAADSANNNPGSYTGVDLGQMGLICGDVCPWFDSLNDYVDILPLNAFDGAEGSLELWARVNDENVWIDGDYHVCALISADGDNFVRVLKYNTNNTLEWRYKAGGVNKRREQGGYSSTDWMQLALTWSATADQVRTFYNGAEVGTPLTGLETWAGAVTVAMIGANDTVPIYVWHGWEAHVSICCGTVLTPAQILNHYNVGIAS